MSRDGQSLGGHSRPDICPPCHGVPPADGGGGAALRGRSLRPEPLRAHQRPHAAVPFRRLAGGAVPADPVHPPRAGLSAGRPGGGDGRGGKRLDGAHLRQLSV
nr:MAG TPA: hypothetical protein [Bacteriophage sp.]